MHVELTKNKRALVDDDLYEWLHWYNWLAMEKKGRSCYAIRKVRVTAGVPIVVIWMHRLIAGVPKDYKIVWINGNSLDNRRSNMRILDPTGIEIDWEGSCGHSKFQGVIWDGYFGLWRVRFDNMLVGYYDNEIEAAKAWNEKAKKFLPNTPLNDLSFL